MTSTEWFGVTLGLLSLASMFLGFCYRQIQELLSAIAHRIRYGKQQPPVHG